MEEITKIVSPVKDKFFAQARYYCGNKEIAGKLHNNKGGAVVEAGSGQINIMPGGYDMKAREIYITQHDMERLRAIIEIYNGNDAPYVDRLEEELDRANIVDPKNIPGDVVTMNSVVRIRDLDTGEEKTFALVFPGKTGEGGKAVSIMAPIGTAIIGYREGDTIEWKVPAGMKRMQIIEIIYQPERLGNYDL